MQSTIDKLPNHLKKYVVSQNYEKYTYEDQAVWRYILRQLKSYLAETAHPSYLDGLIKTGITIDEIPRIENIDLKLKNFGWSAVPISGFIPPAAFMEFQSLGVLPIASDIRTISHILYTPAPDIVHESAGHAPILIEPNFAKYLKLYAEVASKAIFSKEDLDLYAAIRDLSDAKENPKSTKEQIKAYELKLSQVSQGMTYVSEAALLARMNWWTAEYGLIGTPENPKIFGAGLLSSLGESKSCLESHVKKIPLNLHCIDYSYDITEKQPQLFVASDFQDLIRVLNELSEKMAFKVGGKYGLECAKESRTINTIELNSGIQISGIVSDFIEGSNNELIYYRLEGPSQLAFNRVEIPNQGIAQHPHGFSSPLGLLKGSDNCISDMQTDELKKNGIVVGQDCKLTFQSGIVVEGKVKAITQNKIKTQIITFTHCTASYQNKILFNPDWGNYDMAVGCKITSVFGGPADREKLTETDDFQALFIPQKEYSDEQKNLFQEYKKVRELRSTFDLNIYNDAVDRFFTHFTDHWLIGLELYEIGTVQNIDSKSLEKLEVALKEFGKNQPEVAPLIETGLKLGELN